MKNKRKKTKKHVIHPQVQQIIDDVERTEWLQEAEQRRKDREREARFPNELNGKQNKIGG